MSESFLNDEIENVEFEATRNDILYMVQLTGNVVCTKIGELRSVGKTSNNGFCEVDLAFEDIKTTNGAGPWLDDGEIEMAII